MAVMKRGKKSRGLLDTKEPYENNPLVVVREWGALVLIFKACLKRGPLSADLGLVDRVSGNTTWIQHGTVRADWWNKRTDNAAASSWQAVAGPDIA